MLKKTWVKVLLWIVALILVVFAAAAGLQFGLSLVNEYTLSVTLNDAQEITLVYPEIYSEPGATALLKGTVFHKEAIPVDVKITSQPEEGQLGTFLVKYTATYKNVVETAYRRVHIVDTQSPVISLVADPQRYTLPTETYQEEGFTAVDDYDGDITDRVIRTETKEKVTYTVCDASGNYTTVERPIVYNDPIAPEITLKGEEIITITEGETYQEPGFTATDNCDGDLTDRVEVTGNVNRHLAGNYTVVYSVKDAYDNLTSVSRTVCVKPADGGKIPPPEVVIPSGKVIYLTFDDGPGPDTPKLLDILKHYNIKATFFVVNTKYIDTIKRTAAEGHSLAIHTATHVFKDIYASEEAYFEDLYKMRGIIKDLTGVETTLLRFPGGSSNTVSNFNKGIMTRLTEAVVDKGFQYFDWNVDSKDAGGAKTAEQVVENVIGGIGDKKISIVLQHDIKDFSIDAVERIIVWGLNNGYTFLPLEPNSPGSHHGINN